MSSNFSSKKRKTYLENMISSNIEINDIFDELSNENKRLLNELLFANKCLKSLINFKTFVDFISHKFKNYLNPNECQKFEKLREDIEDMKQKTLLCDKTVGKVSQRVVDSQNLSPSDEYKPLVNRIKMKENVSPKMDSKVINANEFSKSFDNNNNNDNNSQELVKCQFCHQMFMTSDDCKRHLKVHTNSTVKPFVCYIPCGRSFSSLQDLKYHSNECHSDHSNRLKAIKLNNGSIDSNPIDNKLKEWIQTNAPKISDKNVENISNDNQINNLDYNSDDGRLVIESNDSNDSDYIPPKTTAIVCDDDHKSMGQRSDSVFKQLIDSNSTQNDLKLKNKNKLIKCPINGCFETFIGKLSIKHLKSVHKDSDLNCSVDGCNQTFKTYIEFVRHLWTHPLYANQLKKGPKSGVVEPYFKTEEVDGQTFYICTIDNCGKRFDKYRNVYEHKRRHKRNQFVFKCQTEGCDYKYCSTTDLVNHKKTIHGTDDIHLEEKLVSKLSSTLFEQANKERSGIVQPFFKTEIRDGQKEFICTIDECVKRFATYTRLYEHSIRHQRKPELIIGYDKKEPTVSPKTVSHQSIAKPRKPPTSAPNKEMKSQSSSTDLSADHKRKKVLLCDYKDCGVVLKGNKAFNEHIKSHEDYRIKCEWKGCNYKCKTIQQMNRHIRLKNTKSKPKVCEVCNKQYATRAGLWNHRESCHRKTDQIFKCDFKGCDKTFKSKSSWWSHRYTWHQKRHIVPNRPKLFKCDFEGCSKAFSFRSQLEIHQAIHKEPSLACVWPGCEYKARILDNLKRHEWVHKPDVPGRFVCSWPECGKAIRDQGNFKYHMRAHLNDKRYVCEWPGCGFRTVAHQSIAKHRKTHKT